MPKPKLKNYLGRNFNKERTIDKLTSSVRSSLMSKVKSKNTGLESVFIGYLRKHISKKFVTHIREIRGHPDIVFKKNKVCVFLDSDFWHGWQFPRWKHLMKSDFWVQKIQNNRARDRRITSYLRKNGWTMVRIWEHQFKNNPEKVLRKILSFLEK